ncbi:MAG: DUF4250 domain-containing protein [Clostridia bacterium]|nr:DUF4250 domain-containing protein [Clostridia bacterium]
MAHIPQDPYMLLSMVNMKLRDRYASLDALCEDWDVSRSEIESVLATLNYHYDPGQNAFI